MVRLREAVLQEHVRQGPAGGKNHSEHTDLVTELHGGIERSRSGEKRESDKIKDSSCKQFQQIASKSIVFVNILVNCAKLTFPKTLLRIQKGVVNVRFHS